MESQQDRSDDQFDRFVDMIARQTLCVSSATPGLTVHHTDDHFLDIARQHFSIHESNAAEELVLLKTKLATQPIDQFWTTLMEGMTSIIGAQYAFVAKRILVDDQNSAVEMPPIGEPGSCLMAVAFYYNDGDTKIAHHRDYKYLAYGAPCAHMKHDKVFIVPGRLPEFVTDCPTEFAFPVEAYLGVPLFSGDKCFAHFGSMWSAPGLERRKLSWTFLEMLHHALEDIITLRLIDGQSLSTMKEVSKGPSVIPQSAITAAQSLKPYARSLSHELRTPMQGVVGMLDIMHATVQESLEAHYSDDVRDIFQTLRENIEAVQDSSRRAVEAADNVVHAYDLNMQVPDTPKPPRDDEVVDVSIENDPHESPGKLNFGLKRRRSDSVESDPVPFAKHRVIEVISTPSCPSSPHTAILHSAVEESEHMSEASSRSQDTRRNLDQTLVQDGILAVGIRTTRVRSLLQVIINESLRIGGRPESAMAECTEYGEIIEVRTKMSNGEIATKMVEWSVDPSLPEEIFIDERDMAKLVSVLFLNAIKFTDRGRIILTASLSPKSRYIIINVRDTGPGIPESFLPYLFKPFSRKDDSLTRQNEGLGLGLLVAKGLARKVGGDLTCVRSDTEGPLRGSEFELKVPLSPSDGASRHSTPSRTPTPTPSSDRLPSPNNVGLTVFSGQFRALDKTSTKHRNTEGPTFQKSTSPLLPSSSSRRNSLGVTRGASKKRCQSLKPPNFDRNLAKKHPLNFLIAEDNRINRKLLVNMLSKLGYTRVHEAFDGAEAVRLMELNYSMKTADDRVDVILMDLWMPNMDGYEAAERIIAMGKDDAGQALRNLQRGKADHPLKILAVTADVTDEALDRAKQVGMVGHMTKPYKLVDLQRLIIQYCTTETI